MRRLLASIATLSLLAFGVGAAAGARGGPPPFPRLAGAWSHAEINIGGKKSPHTLILDRGRIVQVSPLEIVLRHPDGTLTVPPIPLSPTTIITLGKFTVTANVLRKGMYAQTMVIDGGPAVRVKASLRP